ncbi:hypothetical protein QTO30_05940 [Yoonia sp. GPGPB17]
MVAIKSNAFETLEARAFAPNLGAEIYGVDLSNLSRTGSSRK